MASIREVAQQAGVSPATVSRAFATPEMINEQTHQRILEVARRLNYRPPRLREGRPAIGFSRGTTPLPNAIGFQFFSATNEPGDTLGANTFYAPVLSGAQAEASALGLHLLVHSTNRHALSQGIPRMVQEQAIGGLLLVGTADPEVVQALALHVRHIVLVDNRDDNGSFECVLSDGIGGAYAATRHLLDLGHRRIAFLQEGSGVSSFQDRVRGFVCALFEAGIVPSQDQLLGGSENTNERVAQLTQVLRSPDRPTAIVACNDANALIALRVCRDLGLHVPGDVSLVGFDDTEMSRHGVPTLTTVRVDKEFMGRLAVRRLHAHLQEPATKETLRPVCHVQPVTLSVRESSAPPPSATS